MILYHGSRQIVEYPEIRKANIIKISISDFIVRDTKSRQKDGQRVTV